MVHAFHCHGRWAALGPVGGERFTIVWHEASREEFEVT